MAERETETGPDREPSAVGWAARWMGSDLLSPRPGAGEPATRSFGSGASTGVKSTDLAFAPVRFGAYEILEKIGQGGMGAVYKARHRELNRVVALKVVAPRSCDDSAARARFEREAQSLARLEHANIVPLYDAGTWEGLPYFTMKYVPGGALSAHLDRFRADPAAAARLMAKVARAVQRLHQENVLHRDLKPHNILLGDGDEPLVADFGLVKDLGEDSDASMTGAPMGTRQYMSPEQTFAKKADYAPACDIWAVGVILYELLAGERPFSSDDPIELYGLIRAATPRRLTDVNPAAPAALAAVAHRCLAKLPADRYPSAEAVAADLEAWLAGDAVTATLPPPPRRPRRRGMWAAGAAVLLGGAALAVTLLPRPVAVTPAAGPVPPAPVVPAPPAPRSVADRLRAGESVVLIGAKGLPELPTRPLPGSTANLTTDADGECVLPNFEFAAVEVFGEPLPLPLRVTAEIRLGSHLPTGYAGVYVGGVAWHGAATRLQAVCAATIDAGTTATAGDEFVTTSARRGDVVAWAGTSPPNRLTVFDFPTAVDRRPKHRPASHDWYAVDFRVTPGGVEVGPAGAPARRIDWTESLIARGRLAFAGNPPAMAAWVPPPPVPGPGIGVLAVQTQLYVRNLVLTSP